MRVFRDEFSLLRRRYRPTALPIILCPGLFGFDTIANHSYWNGIREVLEEHGARVIPVRVSPLGSIELRAQQLKLFLQQTGTSPVNIIAHSMGGLDARYAISSFPDVPVASLTTIGTPHHGSSMADAFYKWTYRLPTYLGAFSQLTTGYVRREFNPNVYDRPGVVYMSYGAKFTPSVLSPLYFPWKLMKQREGDNDGLVSVKSSQWGHYEGTLDGCSHWDLVNFTFSAFRGVNHSKYFAPAMYLHIMDSLASMGF